jgi:ATP-dependent HslUV protease subunit HslV
MASDGQVTFGDTAVKQRARKIRRCSTSASGRLCGSAADSFAPFAFQAKLEQYRGNLEFGRRAAGLADRPHPAASRSDAHRQRDGQSTHLLSGNGDLIEPDDGSPWH